MCNLVKLMYGPDGHNSGCIVVQNRVIRLAPQSQYLHEKKSATSAVLVGTGPSHRTQEPKVAAIGDVGLGVAKCTMIHTWSIWSQSNY